MTPNCSSPGRTTRRPAPPPSTRSGSPRRNTGEGSPRARRDATGDVEVSISVAASERGRGTGRLLLADGLQAGADFVGPGGSFVARIRPDNAASLALFRCAGFGGGGL